MKDQTLGFASLLFLQRGCGPYYHFV